MGLNRFYTYNGQLLKTAEGNPIGYEAPPYPTSGLVARWDFTSGSLTDSISSKTLAGIGSAPTLSYITGPNADSSALSIVQGAADTFGVGITDETFFGGIIDSTKSYSVSLWAKTLETNWPYSVFAFDITSGYKMQLLYNAGSLRLNAGGWYDATGVNPGLQTWNHYVVSCAPGANGVNLYLNKSLIGTYTTNSISNVIRFILNNSNNAFYSTNNSAYAYIYLYEKALSAPEVAQLYAEV